ncbi:MAG: MCE family protein [Sulfuricella sp.]|nr:MCE family protein [Sulfuricella sp.]
MSEPTLPPNFEDIPEARVTTRRSRLPQLVWIVPLVAALIGIWLAVNTLAQQGPTVVISFLTAEGLEPGKTRIRYKDVDIGEVKSITLSPDRSRVLVTAQLVKQAESFLVADTRFWVVRPRISGGKVSGFGTLLSGAYIGVDVGKSDEPKSQFAGLEVAPILTDGLAGRRFVLNAGDAGSLDVGSPVYFRRIQVGEVIAQGLDKTGGKVTVTIFVHAPYDRNVTLRTRFWNASGVDISLDANGVRVQSQSLAALMLGGVAFETPDENESKESAPPNCVFTLYGDRAQALKAPDGQPLILTLYFEDSLRGLSVGAPVDFRGIVVGEVLSVGVEYDQAREWFHFPVRIALYPERIRLHLRHGEKDGDIVKRVRYGLLKAINERGFRAQLHTGNLLTGQLFIALDFFPDARKTHVSWDQPPLELPTQRGNLEELQVSLNKVLKALEKIPFTDLVQDMRGVLGTLDHTLKGVEKLVQRVDGETLPETGAAIRDLRRTLEAVERTLATDSPLRLDVHNAMHEIERAAQSFRALTDTLEKQPEALLRGKKEDQP